MAARYDGGNWVDWAQTTRHVLWGHWHVCFFLLNLFFILIYIYYISIYKFMMPWLHASKGSHIKHILVSFQRI